MSTRPSLVSVLLRLEGLALLGLGVLGYALTRDGWLLFVVLILAPDLSMIGYAAGPRWGSIAYNLVHTTTWPALAIGYGLLATAPLAVSIGAVWLAHIGLDRLIGYGLKYPSGFKETHLHRV